MIIKKLAVPLVNDKILMQAEHCYIATAAISEQAFDFIKSRIPPKCKMEIVTGLDILTSPSVLRRIWRHYQDRITLKIYTRNFFHPNVYIFDLPYRKTIAFAGSGHFTLPGIKDNEEIFYKIIDQKEIEGLKSWFTGYYEFSEPLTETILREYESIHPYLKQHEISLRQQKEQFIELTTRGFNWEAIKFKNQYFKKEEYLVLGNNKAALETSEIHAERVALQTKFLQLHESFKQHAAGVKLFANADMNSITSSLYPTDYSDKKVNAMCIAYGRSKSELDKYSPSANIEDFTRVEIMLRQCEFKISLVAGKPNESKDDRQHFQRQMEVVDYRNLFFKLVSGLGKGYSIEIAGDKKPTDFFVSEDVLWEFTKSDDWRYYAFTVSKAYAPGEPEISNDNIVQTITKELDKLVLLYNHIRNKPI